MPITGGGFGRPNVIANPVLPKADQIIGNGKTAVTVPTGQSIVVPAGYQMIFNPDAFSVPVLTVPKAGSPGQTVNRGSLLLRRRPASVGYLAGSGN
jgi:hypothetical protein